MTSYSLTDINGIGPAKAELLRAHGIDTPADLANASFDDVVAIPGFSNALAQRIRQAARRLAKAAEREQTEPVFTDASSLTDAPQTPAAEPASDKKKKPKKDKSKKKPKQEKNSKKDKPKKDKKKSKKDKSKKDKKKSKKDKDTKNASKKGKKDKSKKDKKKSRK